METNVQTGQFLEKSISDAVTFVAMSADLPASEITVVNNTAVDIHVRQDNGGVAGPVVFLCKTNSYIKVDGIVNANQVMLRLASAGSAVTVQGRYKN